MAPGANLYSTCPYCLALNIGQQDRCDRCGADLRIARTMACGDTHAMRPALPNTRSRQRQGVRISGVVVEGTGFLRHKVTVYDLSIVGLQFRTPFEIRVGTQVRLSIPLDGQVHQVTGTVRYVGTVPRSVEKLYACGVEFAEEVPELEQMLRSA